jgi:hypothetical protein
MKPVFAFNDYLYEIWPLDNYARKYLTELCETHAYHYELSPTTMGTTAYKYHKDLYFSLKENLSK